MYGFGIFGGEARESPAERVIFDLKELKGRVSLGREDSKFKGPEEGTEHVRNVLGTQRKAEWVAK